MCVWMLTSRLMIPGCGDFCKEILYFFGHMALWVYPISKIYIMLCLKFKLSYFFSLYIVFFL